MLKRASRLDELGAAHRRLSRAKEETLRFIQFHQGRCAICGTPRGDLVVDHDHWSGLVRGFLCSGCNGLEGAGRADSMPLFARYRRRHPAAILNYYEAYVTNGVLQIALSLERREAARQRDSARTATLLVERVDWLCTQKVKRPPRRARELWDDDYLDQDRPALYIERTRRSWEAFTAGRPLSEFIDDPDLPDTLIRMRHLMAVLENAVDRQTAAGLSGLGEMAREVKRLCSALLRYVVR